MSDSTNDTVEPEDSHTIHIPKKIVERYEVVKDKHGRNWFWTPEDRGVR